MCPFLALAGQPERMHKASRIGFAPVSYTHLELAKRIESELEYPGQIKVHVLRETKVIEYAK